MKDSQEKDIKLLRIIYAVIGSLMLLAMQLAPFADGSQRLRVSLIVFIVIFGVGFNATRNLKKAYRKKDRDEK